VGIPKKLESGKRSKEKKKKNPLEKAHKDIWGNGLTEKLGKEEARIGGEINTCKRGREKKRSPKKSQCMGGGEKKLVGMGSFSKKCARGGEGPEKTKRAVKA